MNDQYIGARFTGGDSGSEEKTFTHMVVDEYPTHYSLPYYSPSRTVLRPWDLRGVLATDDGSLFDLDEVE